MPVVVGVAGEAVLDAVPGVLGGELGLVPGLAGGAPVVLVPVAAELGLDLVPVAVAVAGPRLPAVAVGRLVILIGTVRFHVGTVAVALAPVGVLLGGIDPLGGADRRARGRPRRRADPAADRMDLVVRLIRGRGLPVYYRRPMLLVHGVPPGEWLSVLSASGALCRCARQGPTSAVLASRRFRRSHGN